MIKRAVTQQSPKADAHEVRTIAVAAMAGTKTVERYITGRGVRPTSRARIVQALRSLGRQDLLHAEDRLAG